MNILDNRGIPNYRKLLLEGMRSKKRNSQRIHVFQG
jgi:hypothetical protein